MMWFTKRCAHWRYSSYWHPYASKIRGACLCCQASVLFHIRTNKTSFRSRKSTPQTNPDQGKTGPSHSRPAKLQDPAVLVLHRASLNVSTVLGRLERDTHRPLLNPVKMGCCFQTKARHAAWSSYGLLVRLGGLCFFNSTSCTPFTSYSYKTSSQIIPTAML